MQNISFIVPAFNCVETIEETIDSIYDGNFSDGDEVIIIDDASTDQTLQICKNLQNKYTNIKIVRHNINKGSAAARNSGIDSSRNNLLFCIDSDNILEKNSIPGLLNFLKSNDADAAAFGELHYFKASKSDITHKLIYKENEIKFSDALAGHYWPGHSGNYLFTKSSWIKAGRYEESVGGAYDSWAFGIKQLATKSKMVTQPNNYYFHRYGYESTFIKEQNKINPSLIGLSLLLKYLDQINKDDIEYIISKENRNRWFDNLENRPIKLKNHNYGKNGYVKYPSNSTKRIRNYISKYFEIKNYVNYLKRKLNKFML
jgi:glycosyltransferase involved in cell wall biosynthesis